MNTNSGQRIKLWREKSDLSQRALADALGYSQSYIGNIEAGISQPSRNFLTKLTQTYGVSGDWVLHGTGDPVPSLDKETGIAAANPRPAFNPLMLMICGGAVTTVYAELGRPLSQDDHYRDGVWFMNELFARMSDPEDGDEMEALMPQIRAMLAARLAAEESSK